MSKCGSIYLSAIVRDAIRENAKNLARENSIKIHHIRKPNTDKGHVVKSHLKKLKKKGKTVEGLFYIISTQEMCSHYTPTYDEKKGECRLERDWSPTIHYYFYFIDKELGLCFVRVPTWLPCRLEIYFNGHNWLASQLDHEDIDYVMEDNTFFDISDFERAQEISDNFEGCLRARLIFLHSDSK